MIYCVDCLDEYGKTLWNRYSKKNRFSSIEKAEKSIKDYIIKYRATHPYTNLLFSCYEWSSNYPGNHVSLYEYNAQSNCVTIYTHDNYKKGEDAK